MIEHGDRDDGFEATFLVSRPRDDAWRLLETGSPLPEALGAPRDGQWWLPAWESPVDPIEVRDGELFRGRKAVQPCKGTEIVITLEDADTGTRITVVQSGFGSGFADARPWLEAGWWAILADIVAYFEYGVALGRHALPWVGLGCEVIETGAGLKVGRVDAGGLAEAAGVEEGDLLVLIAGAPVVTTRELALLMRGPAQRLGKLDLRWLRGDEVMGGTGAV